MLVFLTAVSLSMCCPQGHAEERSLSGAVSITWVNLTTHRVTFWRKRTLCMDEAGSESFAVEPHGKHAEEINVALICTGDRSPAVFWAVGGVLPDNFPFFIYYQVNLSLLGSNQQAVWPDTESKRVDAHFKATCNGELCYKTYVRFNTFETDHVIIYITSPALTAAALGDD